MSKYIILFIALLFVTKLSFSQEIIRGLVNTASLVKKSQKLPSIKNKDGSTIVLAYKEETGLQVNMSKNGKQFAFCDPYFNALMVQVGEFDIDKDGRMEILVGARTTSESVEVQIYKKPEFETLYKLWTTFTGVQSFEFPGDGTVKMYDMSNNFGRYKITDEGKLDSM